MKNDIEHLFHTNRLSEYESHYKFNFLGIKINIKRRMRDIDTLKLLCLRIQKKLSLPDSICRVKNSKFYVPNYPIDYIQQKLVEGGNFYEWEELEQIKKYLPPPEEGAVICDIGANIGNHSIYWAQYCNARKIYSFEAVDTTYEILRKNIELNNLTDIIVPFNIGLSDKSCTGTICYYNDENIGGTQIKQTNNIQGIKLEKLDNINIQEDKIDFIKIDIEGHESLALRGMENTLKKYKPTIFIEIFPDNYEKVKAILEEYNYEQKENLNGGFDYIFQYKN